MATISLPGQLVRTRRFTLGVPEQFTVALDGTAVLFLRSRAGDDPVTCLWALDLDSGTQRLLADPAELLGACAQTPSGGERARQEQALEQGTGIDAYATDPAAGLVAFTLAGGLWTVEVAEGRPRRHAPCGTRRPARPTPGSRCGSWGWTARGPRLVGMGFSGMGCSGIGAPSNTCRALAGTPTAPTPSCSPATSAPSGFSGSTRSAAGQES